MKTIGIACVMILSACAGVDPVDTDTTEEEAKTSTVDIWVVQDPMLGPIQVAVEMVATAGGATTNQASETHDPQQCPGGVGTGTKQYRCTATCWTRPFDCGDTVAACGPGGQETITNGCRVVRSTGVQSKTYLAKSDAVADAIGGCPTPGIWDQNLCARCDALGHFASDPQCGVLATVSCTTL